MISSLRAVERAAIMANGNCGAIAVPRLDLQRIQQAMAGLPKRLRSALTSAE
jgi:hypothetical protein